MIEITNVTVSFGGVVALRDVSVAISDDVICGIIGPNGAGKTTLFDVISGIQKPTAGTVSLDGQDLAGKGALWRARHGVRRTFQRQQLFGTLSVADNVLVANEWEGGHGGLVADLLSLPGRDKLEAGRRERVHDVLELCGIAELHDVPAGSLPIGIGRIVEFARALVAEPRVLLLDEPTSGLNDAESADLADVIRKVSTERKCVVLLVEHDVAFVMALCRRIVMLEAGQVLVDGPADEVRHDPRARAAYIT